jgi:very-short-patch-repair endonuclease
MPAEAFFCGITAAQIMGVPLPFRLERESVVHVAVPASRRAPQGRGVRGHAVTWSPFEIRDWDGLRVSAPARLWCELAATLSISDLAAAGDHLIHWRLPLTTRAELEDAVDRLRGRRGFRTMQAALPLLDDRAESPQESRLRVIALLGGLSGLVANLPIRTASGHSYRADLAFPAHKVIIEYQSEWHDNPSAFRRDMTRISRLETDGWHVMQVNADDLNDPAELVARIRSFLALHPAVH